MTIYISPFTLLIMLTVVVVFLIPVWLYFTRRSNSMDFLQQRWESYKALYINLPLPVVFLDPEGCVTLWNAAAEKVFGWSEQEVIGHFLPIVSDAYKAEFQVLKERLLKEKTLVGAEIRRTTKNGSDIDLNLSAVLLFDKVDNIIGSIHVYQDITSRKKTEALVREGEFTYRELFLEVERQARELLLLDRVRAVLASELDLKPLFHKVVEAVADTYGYSQVSLYWREGDESVLQHQVGYSNVLERVPIDKGVSGRVYRTGKPILLEDVSQDPDFLCAIERLVSEICIPLVDQGNVVGFFNIESTNTVKLTEADLRLLSALTQDINVAIERTRLHGEVRESEAAFRSLFDRAPIGMDIVSMDGHYLRVNSAYCDIL